MATLTERVALVTGAGGERGFGRAIARRLAEEGADLVLTDIAPTGLSAVPTKPRTGWGGLEAVAADVKAHGRRALRVVAFLVSDGAEYVTGQSINVTGGSVMH